MPLHGLLSVHDVPIATGACVQPVAGSQLSVVHELLSLHTGGAPDWHWPARHVSAPLQALPSLHGVPFASGACWQPATGSQLSVVHAFESSQLSAVPGVHAPLWHVSLPSHALPSLHEAPFGSAACWQPVTGSQLSVVHW